MTTRQLRAAFLPVPEPDGAAVVDVAEAFAASPAWQDMHAAVVAVRRSPTPAWGVLGWFDAAQLARIDAASWQIPDCLGRLRYVGYSQAEDDARELAARLRSRLGDAVASASYRAVPRGGFIVLGMLAYCLDLPAAALRAGASAPQTVVVDDCALSGARLREAIASAPAGGIVVATLYSHPDLRRAVMDQEPAVVDFVSARDLVDHAPSTHGDAYGAWRERWTSRDDRAYWIGHPDHVVFAWSEPDMTIWNPVTQRGEAGWHVVSPRRCLKSRGRGTPRLQILAEPRGPLRPADDVLYGQVEGDVLVCTPTSATVTVLTGLAADLWHGIVDHGDLPGAVAAVEDVYAVERTRLARDAQRVVDDLSDRGLLSGSSR